MKEIHVVPTHDSRHFLLQSQPTSCGVCFKYWDGFGWDMDVSPRYYSQDEVDDAAREAKYYNLMKTLANIIE
jgi:hypothetical protein